MTDLRCTDCGVKKSYADAQIADSLDTCPGDEDKDVSDLETAEDSAVGQRKTGSSHNWKEI